MIKAEASPCFTPGALIATGRGMTPVEELKPGDRVLTADNGLQPIVWIGRKTLRHPSEALREELRPVLIKAGALGGERPTRDIIVSPKHRFVVSWLKVDGRKEELLVAADRLINHTTIRPVTVLGVTYFHLLFERHQVILAEGAWTESFLPEPETWQRIGTAQRCEIEALFPEARTQGLHRLADPARPLDARPLWKRRMGRPGRPSVLG